jgi:hypothetical protein
MKGKYHASLSDDVPERDRHVGTVRSEGIMLTALVLVCSIAATPDLRDCDTINARVVMRVPEAYSNPVTCAMHGQAYLAETAVGRSLSEDDEVKVVCMRQEEADQVIARLSNQ